MTKPQTKEKEILEEIDMIKNQYKLLKKPSTKETNDFIQYINLLQAKLIGFNQGKLSMIEEEILNLTGDYGIGYLEAFSKDRFLDSGQRYCFQKIIENMNNRLNQLTKQKEELKE